MTTLPKKILIVRLGALGDVANALVLAAAIKRAAPDTFVGWAVHNLALPIVEGNPVVDRAYLWDKKLGVRGLISCVREVRAEGYDLAIDLARIFKSSLVARLSGAPRVLGFDRARTKEFAWLFLNESIAPLPDPAYKPRHMVEQYLEFATHLGIEASAEHRLPQNDQAVAWAAEQVDRLARAPVAIGIGASYVSKSWPAERFLDLGRSVAASLNRPVILLGGPGDRELARLELEQLAAASSDDGDDSHQPVVDFVGRTSLAELIAITARAAVFVSCDTGPMHLAVAQGIPVVALFGPGVAGRTGPYNPQPARHEIVAVPPPCAPCNKRTCRMPRHDCMLDIGVELALDAVQRQLERVDAQSS
ncbi:MAG: glycosyltransferase family 9 protein [Planctomycetota bacterium]|nr:glycosyltransferase family 9 protein [Planctomycetota bacterium]